MIEKELFFVVDTGNSDFLGLLRKIRSMGAYAEVLPNEYKQADIVKSSVKGFVYIDTGDTKIHPMIGKLGDMNVALHSYTEGRDAELNTFIRKQSKNLNWSSEKFIEYKIDEIKAQVGDKKVLCALSGGVDSTVTATLIYKAIGKNLTCIFVDTGLMRLNESNFVTKTFKKIFGDSFISVDAANHFLEALKGVTEPEKKRKIIGEEFIKVFDSEAARLGKYDFLAQGTVYPDVIESLSKGNNAPVKSHHNVGGLPDWMEFKLVEPLRELFKDEVRSVGNLLGLPPELINRHPFPGPGLAVRILGEVTKQRCDTLRQADHIAIEEIKKANLYDEIWQAFCVLLPVKTVGIQNGKRTYDNAVALRAVTGMDGMSAEFAKIPYEVLEKISVRILNEVTGINRIVYDISSKPPATIEWE